MNQTELSADKQSAPVCSIDDLLQQVEIQLAAIARGEGGAVADLQSLESAIAELARRGPALLQAAQLARPQLLSVIAEFDRVIDGLRSDLAAMRIRAAEEAYAQHGILAYNSHAV
jgi:hypothetical protein